jgi:hypothetical protein
MAAMEISSVPALTSLSKSGSDENLGKMAQADKMLQVPKTSNAFLILSNAHEKEGENFLAF